MNRWLIVGVGLGLAGLALAADPPKKPTDKPLPVVAEAERGEGVSLTVYNQNFVVVKERRFMDLKQGRSLVRFRDVAATIEPDTVQFSPLRQPDLARVVEQNYEFDLVSADKLLDRYIDRDIGIVTQDGEVLNGTLLSFDPNQLVLKTAKGIDLLPRAGNVKDVRFSALPGGLLTRPTLVWQLDAKKDGKELVKVAYRARAMSWRVDYRARVNQAGDKMDLGGWVTVTNNTGTTFKDAQVKLLAGDVNLIEEGRRAGIDVIDDREKDAKEKPAFIEKSFADYHLYELGRPATLKSAETKQIELLDVANVPVERRYELRPGEAKVAVVLRFKNAEEVAKGLGIPLPKGPVRVFQRDADGELELAGTDAIDHTPKDETLNVRLGYAFDLAGERKQLAQRNGPNWNEQDWEIKLRNHKPEAVKIEVGEAINGSSANWTMLKESRTHVVRDVNTLVYTVELKANSEATVTYSIRYQW
ncbi:MAG TPA: DUF4139 domain-containing protein [Gemmataceae bacterium]|nr:DUF4139 domain-containing protein [Gemmataceae bacterium]